jgi:hypothetical protein
VSELGDARAKLVEALTGEEFTAAPSLDAIKALPALLVSPAPAWLDGTSDSGPGRVVRLQFAVEVVVNAQEPVGALDELEQHVELVLGRLPKHSRFDRGEQPIRGSARGGELTTLAATLLVSTRYSIT